MEGLERLESAFESSAGPRLVAWQREHGRHDLPWQQAGRVRDPYRVWIAEIMLQQTQVAAAIPFYRRFVERFPAVRSLADAPADDVMHAWSGLGYYSRARNLHRAAQLVVERHGGRLPDDPVALEALPGIGRSTAAAIAAFAFGRRGAILDGNVKRVLARLYAIEGDPTSSTTTAALWAIAERLVPEHDVERYTQGMMDLGATVCLPRNPLCLLCPFDADCVARRTGRIDELPTRRVRKVAATRTGTLLFATCGDAVLLERRPPIGIWGGLWSLPACDDAVAAATACWSKAGMVLSCARVPGFTHAFTHFTLETMLIRVRLDEGALDRLSENGEQRWVEREACASLGLPAPIRTLLSAAPFSDEPVDPAPVRMAARQ